MFISYFSFLLPALEAIEAHDCKTDITRFLFVPSYFVKIVLVVLVLTFIDPTLTGIFRQEVRFSTSFVIIDLALIT